jgi:hypothetical protein
MCVGGFGGMYGEDVLWEKIYCGRLEFGRLWVRHI